VKVLAAEDVRDGRAMQVASDPACARGFASA
jgi:hypothetical protein